MLEVGIYSRCRDSGIWISYMYICRNLDRVQVGILTWGCVQKSCNRNVYRNRHKCYVEVL